MRTAVWVVWLGWWAGLWSVFQHLFQAVGAVAILDFYQAAQNLYKAPAPGWMGGPAPAGPADLGRWLQEQAKT